MFLQPERVEAPCIREVKNGNWHRWPKMCMTRVFDESGSSIPVTVIHATPNLITQIKSETVDGYSSVQVTTGAIKTSRVSKASRDTS